MRKPPSLSSQSSTKSSFHQTHKEILGRESHASESFIPSVTGIYASYKVGTALAICLSKASPRKLFFINLYICEKGYMPCCVYRIRGQPVRVSCLLACGPHRLNTAIRLSSKCPSQLSIYSVRSGWSPNIPYIFRKRERVLLTLHREMEWK